jgi:transcriptional repressor NrdR
MDCLYCSGTKSRVIDKRASPGGIRRRRECLKCGKRYTTYEKVARGDIWIIKKDGTRERFDLEKLKKGVEKAFEKRPVSHEKINKMINEIEESLRRKGKKEIKSDTLGGQVMKKIKKLDDIAYIRFASVYKNFQNINDFKLAMKEI